MQAKLPHTGHEACGCSKTDPISFHWGWLISQIAQVAEKNKMFKAYLKDPTVPRHVKKESLGKVLDQLDACKLAKNFVGRSSRCCDRLDSCMVLSRGWKVFPYMSEPSNQDAQFPNHSNICFLSLLRSHPVLPSSIDFQHLLLKPWHCKIVYFLYWGGFHFFAIRRFPIDSAHLQAMCNSFVHTQTSCSSSQKSVRLCRVTCWEE